MTIALGAKIGAGAGYDRRRTGNPPANGLGRWWRKVGSARFGAIGRWAWSVRLGERAPLRGGRSPRGGVGRDGAGRRAFGAIEAAELYKANATEGQGAPGRSRQSGESGRLEIFSRPYGFSQFRLSLRCVQTSETRQACESFPSTGPGQATVSGSLGRKIPLVTNGDQQEWVAARNLRSWSSGRPGKSRPAMAGGGWRTLRKSRAGRGAESLHAGRRNPIYIQQSTSQAFHLGRLLDLWLAT